MPFRKGPMSLDDLYARTGVGRGEVVEETVTTTVVEEDYDDSWWESSDEEY